MTKVERLTIPAPLLAPIDRPAIPEGRADLRDLAEALASFDGALASCNGRLGEIKARQERSLTRSPAD